MIKARKIKKDRELGIHFRTAILLEIRPQGQEWLAAPSSTIREAEIKIKLRFRLATGRETGVWVISSTDIKAMSESRCYPCDMFAWYISS